MCSPEYRLAVSCWVRRRVPSAGRRRRKSPRCLRVDCATSSERARPRHTTKISRYTRGHALSVTTSFRGVPWSCALAGRRANAWTGPTCGASTFCHAFVPTIHTTSLIERTGDATLPFPVRRLVSQQNVSSRGSERGCPGCAFANPAQLRPATSRLRCLR